MEVPDKIYLGIQDLGSGYVYNISIDNNGEQEYIRKDILLYELKNELDNARNTDFDEFGRGEVITLERIINKLNSL